MSKPKNSLESTLKTDAAALTPAFSQSLHDCIIAALRQQGARGTALPVDVSRAAASPYRPTWRWPAVAAILALGGALWLFSATNNPQTKIAIVPPHPTPTATPSLPSIPVSALIQTAVDPTRAKLEDGKYAYLDHDARRLANFVLSQLPGE